MAEKIDKPVVTGFDLRRPSISYYEYKWTVWNATLGKEFLVESNDVLNQKWREVNAQLNLNSRIRPVLFNRGRLLQQTILRSKSKQFRRKEISKGANYWTRRKIIGREKFRRQFSPYEISIISSSTTIYHSRYAALQALDVCPCFEKPCPLLLGHLI